MTWELFCKAILVGVVNAAPVGPVGILCLRSHLCEDRRGAMSAASGMACGYLVVSLSVLLGMKAIVHYLEEYREALQILLGALLVAMGGRSLIREISGKSGKKAASRRMSGFLATFSMTLLNPVPFATFSVILVFLQVARTRFDLLTDIWFSVSVFAGTIGFWWCLRLLLDALLKRKKESIRTDRIVMVTGFLLVGFGLVLLSTAFSRID